MCAFVFLSSFIFHLSSFIFHLSSFVGIRASTNAFIAQKLFAIGVNENTNTNSSSSSSSSSSKDGLLDSKSKRTNRHTVAGSATRRGTSRSTRVASSIVSQLRASITNLVKKLNVTKPHFIRCIKPNQNKSISSFDSKLVLHQLKCMGVLEAIQIQQRGYPVRLTQQEFVHRYVVHFCFLRPKK